LSEALLALCPTRTVSALCQDSAAGKLDEETRAGHVAGDDFIRESAGDEDGLVVEDDVDRAAKTLTGSEQ